MICLLAHYIGDVFQFGIKIPGIQFPDQKYSNDNNQTIMNVTEYSIMMQIKHERCIKYNMWRPSSKWVSVGTQGGNLHESQGGLPRSSPLRSDGTLDSQTGRMDCVSGGQRHLKGGHQFESIQVRWFSWQSSRDEVRTTVPLMRTTVPWQNCVTATLSTGESFLLTQYL